MVGKIRQGDHLALDYEFTPKKCPLHVLYSKPAMFLWGFVSAAILVPLGLAYVGGEQKRW